MAVLLKRPPKRGEIWFVKLRVDPPDNGLRPVLIVSVDARNQHERADTVLAVPLTTAVHREVPTHVVFSAGETGLPADSAARAEDITVIRKDSLVEPRATLRRISNTRICQVGRAAQIRDWLFTMICDDKSPPSTAFPRAAR